jgi:tRNA1(Val) A37 N6-methylase TrmN6
VGAASGEAPGDDEDVCYLAGEWQLFQKQRGHRWSLDDLVTAHVAAQQVAAPPKCLDLGCGIGSVLLMIAWRFPHAQCLGVEAQATSVALARKSIAWNGAGARVRLLEGDFRGAELDRHFALVTGTPPYFPAGTGTVSEKQQAGPCRFEQRGGVEAYCHAANRALADDGVFVFCESAGQRDRVEQALRDTGLSLRSALQIIPLAGKVPLITVFAAARTPPDSVAEGRLVVRDSPTKWSSDFLEVRAAMGMPPAPDSR